jgi:hypothetical protein
MSALCFLAAEYRARFIWEFEAQDAVTPRKCLRGSGGDQGNAIMQKRVFCFRGIGNFRMDSGISAVTR